MSVKLSASRVIPAGQFKNQCLALMDEMTAFGGELVITKHGRPVARLLPIVEDELADVPIFGSMAGTLTFLEDDITAPIGEMWDADRDD
ncbi:MAG: type II toxin-antitoxin system prevent-host-death family antitoxin [Proteobacteria bacterium]|nr:type II toxin-antitoxin system prevent-host-death family antitoxin [Pseudomonadota bacterium]